MALLKMGEHIKAQQMFESALSEAILCKDPMQITVSYRNLAELALEQNRFDDAINSFKSLFDTAITDALRVSDYGQYARCIANADAEVLQKAGIAVTERNAQQLHYLQTWGNREYPHARFL